MARITQDDLDERRNSHIMLPGDRTVLYAVRTLLAANGEVWWHLIVELDNGRYLAARFSDLSERAAAEGEAFFALQLADMGEPLKETPAIDQSADLDQALQLAEAAPSGVVVVTIRGEFAGILCGPTARSADLFGSTSLFDWVPGQKAEKPPLLDEAEALCDEPRRAMREPEPESEAPALADDVVDTEAESPAPMAPAPAPQPIATQPASAPPSPPPPAGAARGRMNQEEAKEKEGAAALSVDVGGDVASGGQVIVAGDDVNITHYHGLPPEETREQFRRFEAAYPQEAHLGVEEKLRVAVMLPDAPSPFGEANKPQSTAGTGAIGIEMPVDRATGELKPVDIEVAVTAAGFRMKGDAKKTLTIWPDGRTTERWFLLETEKEGLQQIMIELSHNGRLLDEITLEARVFAPEKKGRSLLNLSLRIVSFNLQVSFAAG